MRLRDVPQLLLRMEGAVTDEQDASVRIRRLARAKELEWEAEPQAVGFYEQLGGRYLRDSEPSVWGRVIPVLGVDLRPRLLNSVAFRRALARVPSSP